MGKCITPGYLRNPFTSEWVSYPCGQCPRCIGNKISAWAFRLTQEQKISKSSYFITLTYDDEFLPRMDDGNGTLRLDDLQRYIKRLRKINENRLRYYAVGEYGSNTMRPHYHAIFFNAKEETFQEAWREEDQLIGHVHVGSVEPASIRYTLKYMQKINKSELGKRMKEFAVMSKGIGENYLSREVIRYHHQSVAEFAFCTMEGGVKVPMPRYYREKLYSAEEKKLIRAAVVDKDSESEWELHQGHLQEFRRLAYHSKQGGVL